jgi:hypothetical protein
MVTGVLDDGEFSGRKSIFRIHFGDGSHVIA